MDPGRGEVVDPASVKTGGFMEMPEIGHMDSVGCGPVAGVRAAEDGVDPEITDERLGMGDAFALRQQRDRLGQVAVDLGDIEDREAPGENAAGRTVVVTGTVFIADRVRLLPQHDGRAALAPADLRFERLPLVVGAPNAVLKAGGFGGDPESENVDAAIALARSDVGRPGDRGSGMVPGHLELAGAGLDGGDDLGRDAGVDVGAVLRHGIVTRRAVTYTKRSG
jgi:hypothetical protein